MKRTVFTFIVCVAWVAMASQAFAQFPGATRDYWTGATLPLDAGGVPNFSLLANDPNFLGTPSGSSGLVNFDAPLNVSGVFVSRVYSSFVAPSTGNYLFWVAANNQAALYISTTPSFAGLLVIAKSTRLPSPSYRQWSKAAEQKSAAQPLVAGQRYYLLLVHVEDGNSVNHAEVRWLTPPDANCPTGCDEGPIPGNRFTTFTFPQPFSFTMSNGGAKTTTQGSSVVNSITATLATGTTQVVSFSVTSGLPAGATVQFAVSSCNPTCSSSAMITPMATSPTGTFTIVVTGTAGLLTQTTSFALTVNPSFVFALTNNGPKSVFQGASVAENIGAALMQGATEPVSFSDLGLPSGATSLFSPTSCSPPCTTGFTVNTSPSTPTGVYTVTAGGQAGPASQTTSFSLTVNRAGAVTLGWTDNLNPPNVTNYRVLWGLEAGGESTPVEAGNIKEATISVLVPGITYYFVVVAFNNNGVSGPSNEVSYPTP